MNDKPALKFSPLPYARYNFSRDIRTYGMERIMQSVG